MKYEIIRTDTADTQLRDVLFYIADDSGDVDIALAYLANGVIAKHPSLRRMGFRMIIVENHLVFYKIRERDFTVIVYAVVDARQDYTNWIV